MKKSKAEIYDECEVPGEKAEMRDLILERLDLKQASISTWTASISQ